MSVANVIGKVALGAVVAGAAYGIYRGVTSAAHHLSNMTTLGFHLMNMEGQLEELVASHRGMPDAQELVVNRIKIIWDSKISSEIARTAYAKAAYADLIEKAVVLLSVDALKNTDHQEPKASPDTPAE